ncbi:MAG: solute-binding protein [Firmicutes bacterium]|nr:solute-binding protein [Bacillota bacterium]
MRSRTSAVITFALLGTILTVAGCGKPVERKPLVLATTTSTADTGLLDVLNPAFEKKFPYTVKTIAVGTGEALKLGEKKEADVLLVHARKSEDKFMADGFGTRRLDVMYNDFVLVGSKDDPAKIRGLKEAKAALAAIAGSNSTFITRGDNSGTHQKEKQLWEAAGIKPEGAWYVSTGQGMGASLKIASEKKGYTLSDRGTYLATKGLDLEILVEKDPALLNPYGVIEVKGAKNTDGAKAYAGFITSAEGQKIIADYGKDKFGQPLFFPSASQGK